MDFKTMSLWGAIVISVLAMLTFIVSLAFAWKSGDAGLLNLMVGAVISNASTAVAFWLGSSSGSQKKDERQSGAAP
jgi:hypothetical protein